MGWSCQLTLFSSLVYTLYKAQLRENGTAILLKWNEPTDCFHGGDVLPATGYQVYRWDLTYGFTSWNVHVNNTNSTETSYIDRDVVPNSTYIYIIRAWNDWGLVASAGRSVGTCGSANAGGEWPPAAGPPEKAVTPFWR